MKKILLLFTVLSVSLLAQAQRMQKMDKGVFTHFNGQKVEIRFYDDNIVRITKNESVHSWNAQPELSDAPVVTMIAKDVDYDLKQEKGKATISTSAVVVTVDYAAAKVSIADKEGKTLIAEKEFGAQYMPVEYAGQKTNIVKQAWKLADNEIVYGLGQQQTGQFSQRNRRFKLWQENMIICMPYFYSSRGYGLLWNNASPTMWSDTKNETSFESEWGSAVDYYVIAGNTADKVIAGLRELTGHVPMNALWTYGYWQSRERYTNQDELVGIVRKYRELQVPLDVVVQDWQYWGHDDHLWNGVTWTKEEFPEPTRMMNEIHGLHAHAIASVWPSFGDRTEICKDMKKRGYMLGIKTFPENGADVYDAFNPDARQLFWEYLNKNMFSTGLDGWWLDATEPEIKQYDNAMNVNTYLGKFRKNANAFPIYCVKDVYKNQRKTTSDKRVAILTRSAYLGQQRTGSISWSGDIDARWDVLAKQIPAGLNFSLCGNPNWNTDLGGFWVRDFDGNQDPRYRELYVRWIQYGVFMSIMRSHGTSTPREIWQFGERGTWAFDAVEKAIRLRYALVPYIYSTAWQVSHNDYTFMRPLIMDFAEDPAVANMATEYMFGHSLLVAPVTEPMYVDQNKNFNPTPDAKKVVYLPKGCNWYEYFTNKLHQGGTTHARTVAIDEMPLYVRAGSILPIGPDVQYTSEKKWDNLTLRVYPGADADFTLYEDEGDNYNYEQGQRTEIAMHWDDAAKTLTIAPRQGAYKGMLKSRTFNVNVIGGKAAKVKYNGKKVLVKL